jgi:cytochrome c peroxidase
MSRFPTRLALLAIVPLAGGLALLAHGQADRDPPRTLGDGPVIRQHINQVDIETGFYPLDTLLQKGRALFVASFNTFDGVGRPEATGGDAPVPRARRTFPDNFNRASGPDSNSCVGCHNMPRPGGGGDNAANVFVLAQFQEFTTDISAATGNERNTMGMWGGAAIEMLAREMSAELEAIRETARQQAKKAGQPVSLPLVTKGISFGKITARPDGSVDASGVKGVDGDLIIRPFHQKGVVPSVRQFTVNAFNHHHGMQASERYGDGVDFDKDGVADELTRGDITAVTVFQAAMEVPGQVIPRDAVVEQAIRAGETLFSKIGCATCHVPALTVNNPIFSEPNPYTVTENPDSPPDRVARRPSVTNLALTSDSFKPVLASQRNRRPFTFDITRQGPLPRPERTAEGKVIVRAFTDLKRHEMGPLCNNEKIVQAGVPTDQFITKKLWGFYSEPPFMHNGRATTVTEAILMHGGDAQDARLAFEALSKPERDQLVEFLKSLQVLPEGTTSLIVDENDRAR